MNYDSSNLPENLNPLQILEHTNFENKGREGDSRVLVLQTRTQLILNVEKSVARALPRSEYTTLDAKDLGELRDKAIEQLKQLDVSGSPGVKSRPSGSKLPNGLFNRVSMQTVALWQRHPDDIPEMPSVTLGAPEHQSETTEKVTRLSSTLATVRTGAKALGEKISDLIGAAKNGVKAALAKLLGRSLSTNNVTTLNEHLKAIGIRLENKLNADSSFQDVIPFLIELDNALSRGAFEQWPQLRFDSQTQALQAIHRLKGLLESSVSLLKEADAAGVPGARELLEQVGRRYTDVIDGEISHEFRPKEHDLIEGWPKVAAAVPHIIDALRMLKKGDHEVTRRLEGARGTTFQQLSDAIALLKETASSEIEKDVDAEDQVAISTRQQVHLKSALHDAAAVDRQLAELGLSMASHSTRAEELGSLADNSSELIQIATNVDAAAPAGYSENLQLLYEALGQKNPGEHTYKEILTLLSTFAKEIKASLPDPAPADWNPVGALLPAVRAANTILDSLDAEFFAVEEQQLQIDATAAAIQAKMRRQPHFNLEVAKAAIDSYPAVNDAPDIDAILNAEGQNVLFDGKTKEERANNQQQARKAFLSHLQERAASFQAMDPQGKTVDMETLLGSEGVKLYKAAIAEERESSAFRLAVLQTATSKYLGPKWSKRLVMYIGGPSAAGKSFIRDLLVEKAVGDITPTFGEKVDNLVISIDGGIERDLSQMRGMALSFALALGYKGIEDLHKQTKLGTKSLIEKAADVSKANIVIPATFINGYNRLKNKMKRLAEDPSVHQAFAEVRSRRHENPGDDRAARVQFQGSVEYNGASRAWYEGERYSTELQMNKELPCESKVYEAKYFRLGVAMSRMARRFFDRNVESGVVMAYESDVMHLKKVDEQWCPTKVDPELKFVTKREFDLFIAMKENSDGIESCLKDLGGKGTAPDIQPDDKLALKELAASNDLKGFVDKLNALKLRNQALLKESRERVRTLNRESTASQILEDDGLSDELSWLLEDESFEEGTQSSATRQTDDEYDDASSDESLILDGLHSQDFEPPIALSRKALATDLVSEDAEISDLYFGMEALDIRDERYATAFEKSEASIELLYEALTYFSDQLLFLTSQHASPEGPHLSRSQLTLAKKAIQAAISTDQAMRRHSVERTGAEALRYELLTSQLDLLDSQITPVDLKIPIEHPERFTTSLEALAAGLEELQRGDAAAQLRGAPTYATLLKLVDTLAQETQAKILAPGASIKPAEADAVTDALFEAITLMGALESDLPDIATSHAKTLSALNVSLNALLIARNPNAVSELRAVEPISEELRELAASLPAAYNAVVPAEAYPSIDPMPSVAEMSTLGLVEYIARLVYSGQQLLDGEKAADPKTLEALQEALFHASRTIDQIKREDIDLMGFDLSLLEEHLLTAADSVDARMEPNLDQVADEQVVKREVKVFSETNIDTLKMAGAVLDKLSFREIKDIVQLLKRDEVKQEELPAYLLSRPQLQLNAEIAGKLASVLIALAPKRASKLTALIRSLGEIRESVMVSGVPKPENLEELLKELQDGTQRLRWKRNGNLKVAKRSASPKRKGGRHVGSNPHTTIMLRRMVLEPLLKALKDGTDGLLKHPELAIGQLKMVARLHGSIKESPWMQKVLKKNPILAKEFEALAQPDTRLLEKADSLLAAAKALQGNSRYAPHVGELLGAERQLLIGALENEEFHSLLQPESVKALKAAALRIKRAIREVAEGAQKFDRRDEKPLLTPIFELGFSFSFDRDKQTYKREEITAAQLATGWFAKYSNPIPILVTLQSLAMDGRDLGKDTVFTSSMVSFMHAFLDSPVNHEHIDQATRAICTTLIDQVPQSADKAVLKELLKVAEGKNQRIEQLRAKDLTKLSAGQGTAADTLEGEITSYLKNGENADALAERLHTEIKMLGDIASINFNPSVTLGESEKQKKSWKEFTAMSFQEPSDYLRDLLVAHPDGSGLERPLRMAQLLLKIGQRALAENDFNTVFLVGGALGGSAARRVVEAKSDGGIQYTGLPLTAEDRKTLQALQAMVSPSQGSKKYRDQLAQADARSLYVGLLNQDQTFIKDGNSTLNSIAMSANLTTPAWEAVLARTGRVDPESLELPALAVLLKQTPPLTEKEAVKVASAFRQKHNTA